MSKYIRVKDGIMTEAVVIFVKTICGKCFGIDKENIVKKADTIEELCDMFVVVDKERHIQLSDIEDTNKECLKRVYFVSNNYIVYGAIWTDKGLIYVAKMSEKGELELI